MLHATAKLGSGLKEIFNTQQCLHQENNVGIKNDNELAVAGAVTECGGRSGGGRGVGGIGGGGGGGSERWLRGLARISMMGRASPPVLILSCLCPNPGPR